MSSSWEGAEGLGFVLQPSSSGLGNLVLFLRIAVLIAKPCHMEQAEPLTSGGAGPATCPPNDQKATPGFLDTPPPNTPSPLVHWYF